MGEHLESWHELVEVWRWLLLRQGRWHLRYQRLLHVDAWSLHQAWHLHLLLPGRVGRQGSFVGRFPREDSRWHKPCQGLHGFRSPLDLCELEGSRPQVPPEHGRQRCARLRQPLRGALREEQLVGHPLEQANLRQGYARERRTAQDVAGLVRRSAGESRRQEAVVVRSLGGLERVRLLKQGWQDRRGKLSAPRPGSVTSVDVFEDIEVRS